MKIAIVGAGALGLYYGSLLARHSGKTGARITFLARSDFSVLGRRGIIVHSIHGDFQIQPIQVVRHARDLSEQDLILIGIKTTENAFLKDLVLPAIGPHTLVLTLQNGLGNEELLSDFLPAEQIMGGAAFLCSNRTGPGEILHSGYGAVAIASFSERPVVSPETIQYLFLESSMECSVERNLLEMRFRKQVWNVPFNTLCTIHDAPTSFILSQPDLLSQTERVMREVVQLGRTVNSRLSTLRNCSYSYTLSEDTVASMIEKTGTMGDYLPSMLLDRRAGRKLESQSIIYNCLLWRDLYAPSLPLEELSRLADELRVLEKSRTTY
ncbi:MAG: 2-dehydropantoate 2-reductase [Spirochaetales bacterium]|nr:2-dehydropantoate 2-reductase [Spirochaetales bacterium]